MFGALENSNTSDWKLFVQSLVHAYNATRLESAGFSRFNLKFGRQPLLAVDALLGIQTDSVTGSRKKLRKCLDFAYQRATEEANKQTERYKVCYDQKVIENALEVGDKVLVEKVGLTCMHKIAERWEEKP